MRRLHQKNMLSRVAIFVLLLLTFSCSRYTNSTRSISDLSALNNLVSSRYCLISSNNFKLKYSTVVNFDGKDNKLSGKIIISADSTIYLNVISSLLGVEIAQARFTYDSVLFVNKIDKKYFFGSYNDFVKFLDVDYSSLLSIFTSSYIRSDSIDFNDKKAFYLSDLKRFIVNDSYYRYGDKSYVTTQFDHFGNVEKIEFKSPHSNFLTVNYANFVNSYGFPASIAFSTKYKQEKLKLDLNIVSVEVLKNESPSIKIVSLDNYSRINL